MIIQTTINQYGEIKMERYIYSFVGFKCDEDIDEDDVFLNATMYIAAESKDKADKLFKKSLLSVQSVLYDRNINADGSLKDDVSAQLMEDGEYSYIIDLGD